MTFLDTLIPNTLCAVAFLCAVVPYIMVMVAMAVMEAVMKRMEQTL